MILKNFFKIILTGLMILPLWLTETAYGCYYHPYEVFMTSSQFYIGEVVAIDESEILIDVADYFTTNEESETIPEVLSLGSNISWHLELGDYVIVSFGSGIPDECVPYTGLPGSEIFHVTSLDYATLRVNAVVDQDRIMLTNFVNHRATYVYRLSGSPTGSIIYRTHRYNPIGSTIIHYEFNLIVGQITTIDEDAVTIEVWDYVTSDGRELALDRLSLRSSGQPFEGFNVGDDIAINLRHTGVSGEDARTMSTYVPRFHSTDIFSVNILDDGSMHLEYIREDSSVSAFYTDLLQHRSINAYVVTFGGVGRYKSVARLVDDELVMIYEQEEVLEELVDLADEAWVERLIPWVTVGIGGVLGVAVVVVVTKKRKRMVDDGK